MAAVPQHWHLVNGSNGDESVWEYKSDALDMQREMREDGSRAHVHYCRTPNCPFWIANRAGHRRTAAGQARTRIAQRAARRRFR